MPARTRPSRPTARIDRRTRSSSPTGLRAAVLTTITVATALLPTATPAVAAPIPFDTTMSTPGAGTFEIPAEVTAVTLTAWGGGGGGGGSAGVDSGGAGGGAGATLTCTLRLAPHTEPLVLAYVVGAGGEGGTAAADEGGAPGGGGGGATTVGTTGEGTGRATVSVVAPGGGGGGGGSATGQGGAGGRGGGEHGGAGGAAGLIGTGDLDGSVALGGARGGATTCSLMSAASANVVVNSTGRGNGSNAHRPDGRLNSGSGLGGRATALGGSGGDGGRDLVTATNGADGGLRVQYDT